MRLTTIALAGLSCLSFAACLAEGECSAHQELNAAGLCVCKSASPHCEASDGQQASLPVCVADASAPKLLAQYRVLRQYAEPYCTLSNALRLMPARLDKLVWA